jgi:hypothetical protein
MATFLLWRYLKRISLGSLFRSSRVQKKSIHGFFCGEWYTHVISYGSVPTAEGPLLTRVLEFPFLYHSASLLHFFTIFDYGRLRTIKLTGTFSSNQKLPLMTNNWIINLAFGPVTHNSHFTSFTLHTHSTSRGSRLLCNWRSVSMSWYRAPLWDLRPDITSCWNLNLGNLGMSMSEICSLVSVGLKKFKVCSNPNQILKCFVHFYIHR